MLRLPVALVAIFMAGSAAFATSFSIPAEELFSSEFSAAKWGGPATRSAYAPAVAQFTFQNLDLGSAGVEDDYPVAPVYGQRLPSHANGDFSMFDGYRLWIENLDAQPVFVALYLNTGFTGPSGTPTNTPANDTFWQTPWTQLQPGEARQLFLRFDDAIPYHVGDNPFPHTPGGVDGVAMAINAYDRTEVDTVGFEIYTVDNPAATLLVSPEALQPAAPSVPEPATVTLFGLGAAGLAWMRRRR